MAESKEEAEKRTLRELEGKNIAHYLVLLAAWIETRMERDKTLVTLSAAAIGLLVTILTTVGVKRFWDIPLFAVAVASFIITIWSSLTIYQLNSQHLEAAIKGTSGRDPRLEKYDKLSIRSFIVGTTAALLIGISSASYQLVNQKENTMPDQKSSSQSGELTGLKGSVSGITKLHPNAITGKKSLNGITNLNPQATQQTPQIQNQTQDNTTNQNSSADSSSDNQ